MTKKFEQSRKIRTTSKLFLLHRNRTHTELVFTQNFKFHGNKKHVVGGVLVAVAGDKELIHIVFAKQLAAFGLCVAAEGGHGGHAVAEAADVFGSGAERFFQVVYIVVVEEMDSFGRHEGGEALKGRRSEGLALGNEREAGYFAGGVDAHHYNVVAIIGGDGLPGTAVVIAAGNDKIFLGCEEDRTIVAEYHLLKFELIADAFFAVFVFLSGRACFC